MDYRRLRTAMKDALLPMLIGVGTVAVVGGLAWLLYAVTGLLALAAVVLMWLVIFVSATALFYSMDSFRDD